MGLLNQFQTLETEYAAHTVLPQTHCFNEKAYCWKLEDLR